MVDARAIYTHIYIGCSTLPGNDDFLGNGESDQDAVKKFERYRGQTIFEKYFEVFQDRIQGWGDQSFI